MFGTGTGSSSVALKGDMTTSIVQRVLWGCHPILLLPSGYPGTGTRMEGTKLIHMGVQDLSRLECGEKKPSLRVLSETALLYWR